MTEETRICTACNKPLRGRIDKKFCDDYCRNNYNNARKPERTNEKIRNINNALLKNRRILSALLDNAEHVTRFNRERLLLLGFSFKYFTHTGRSSRGNTYYYCYDYGYFPMENDRILLVRQKEKTVLRALLHQ